MEEFKVRIKIGALLSRGITDSRLINKDTKLDIAISQLAGRVLQTSQKIVFFFAYGCESTMEDIQERLFEDLRKEYEIETVKKYAIEAEKRLISESSNAKEVTEWQTKYHR